MHDVSDRNLEDSRLKLQPATVCFTPFGNGDSGRLSRLRETQQTQGESVNLGRLSRLREIRETKGESVDSGRLNRIRETQKTQGDSAESGRLGETQQNQGDSADSGRVSRLSRLRETQQTKRLSHVYQRTLPRKHESPTITIAWHTSK